MARGFSAHFSNYKRRTRTGSYVCTGERGHDPRNISSPDLAGYRKSTFTTEAAERFASTRKLAGHNTLLSGKGVHPGDTYYRVCAFGVYWFFSWTTGCMSWDVIFFSCYNF